MAGTRLTGYPTGWFVVCFSEDDAAGTGVPTSCPPSGSRWCSSAARTALRACSTPTARTWAQHLGYGRQGRGRHHPLPFHSLALRRRRLLRRGPLHAKEDPSGAQECAHGTSAKIGTAVVLLHHDRENRAPHVRDPRHSRVRDGRVAALGNGHLPHQDAPPQEIIDNLADRAHFLRRTPDRPSTSSRTVFVEGPPRRQEVKGTAPPPRRRGRQLLVDDDRTTGRATC